MVGCLAAEIGDVTLHAFIVAAQQLRVARPQVLLPRDQHMGSAPLRRIAKAVFENLVLRRDVGHQPVVQLRVGHVIHALGEELCQVELVAQGRAVEVILFEPTELLAMRTVGHDAHHVAALRPAYQCANPVEQIVGAGKLPYRLGRGMDDHAFDPLDCRQIATVLRRHALDLKVPTTVIEELGEPGLAVTAGQGILPIARSIVGARLAIHGPVFID